MPARRSGTPSTLRSRSDDAESETLLASISDVVRVGDRAFIYLTRDTAYILPREGVRSGDFDGFVDALRLAMVSARN